MNRYISVDSGKSFTKTSTLNPDVVPYIMANPEDIKLEGYNGQVFFKNLFRTKFETDTFEDTEPGPESYLVEYEGQVYKVGRTARIEAELENTKMTPIHKLCTMFAIATWCSDTEVDDVAVGVGIPILDYNNVEKRNSYRDYIIPLGEHVVKYVNNGAIVTKTFNIVNAYVYPESIGAIYAAGVNSTGTVGVIDIGHLNVNMALYSGMIPNPDSITTKKGANHLVKGLAAKLTSQYSFINAQQTAEILSRKGADRCLKPVRKNPEIEASSKLVIDEYIKEYVNSILDDARSANWAIDYMQLCVIGGTTSMIHDDLIEGLGAEIIIPEDGNFVNVVGILKAMLARKELLRIDTRMCA